MAAGRDHAIAAAERRAATPEGRLRADGEAAVLTPRPTVNAIAAGCPPALHGSFGSAGG